MMVIIRYPEGREQAVRERIVRAASLALRRSGLERVSIPALMKQVGLTASHCVVVALTMVAEMLPIIIRAARGTASHFNVQGTFNSVLWAVMVVIVIIATLTMGACAVIAPLRPLEGADGLRPRSACSLRDEPGER